MKAVYRRVPKLMFFHRLWTGGLWETMAQVSQTLAQEKPFNRLWHTTQTLDKGLFLRVLSRIIVIFTIFHLLPLALALVTHGTEYAFDLSSKLTLGRGIVFVIKALSQGWAWRARLGLACRPAISDGPQTVFCVWYVWAFFGGRGSTMTFPKTHRNLILPACTIVL